MMIGSIVERWDKHQIVLYLVAIAAGGAVGLTLPQIAPTLEHSIEPVLMLLLFATFLGVPLIEVGRAFRDIRFLSTVMIANFVVVPGTCSMSSTSGPSSKRSCCSSFSRSPRRRRSKRSPDAIVQGRSSRR